MVAHCANSHRIQLATASFPLLHLQPLTVCENRRWGGPGRFDRVNDFVSTEGEDLFL